MEEFISMIFNDFLQLITINSFINRICIQLSFIIHKESEITKISSMMFYTIYPFFYYHTYVSQRHNLQASQIYIASKEPIVDVIYRRIQNLWSIYSKLSANMKCFDISSSIIFWCQWERRWLKWVCSWSTCSKWSWRCLTMGSIIITFIQT